MEKETSTNVLKNNLSEKVVYLLTGNKYKLNAALGVFTKYGIKLKMLDKNYPEIQADTSLEIARNQALLASKEFNIPVIREDHSLYFNKLGIPGPYTNYIEKKISAELLISLLGEEKDGYFEIGTVYSQPDGFTKELVYQIPIEVSTEIRGERGNWDKVLMIKGSGKTFAECNEGENTHLWQKNYEVIAKLLAGIEE